MPVAFSFQNLAQLRAGLIFLRRPEAKCASRLCLLAVLLLILAALPTAAQSPATGQIKGTVTDESKPLASVVVSLANVHAGKSFKIKTDDFGRFVLQDAPYGYYELEIVGTDGERLLQQQLSIIPAGASQTATVNIDVSRSKTTSAPGDPAVYGGLRTLPEPNIKNKKEKNKEIARQNEKISEMNVLILQANAAALSGKWQDAAAVDRHGSRWLGIFLSTGRRTIPSRPVPGCARQL